MVEQLHSLEQLITKPVSVSELSRIVRVNTTTLVREINYLEDFTKDQEEPFSVKFSSPGRIAPECAIKIAEIIRSMRDAQANNDMCDVFRFR